MLSIPFCVLEDMSWCPLKDGACYAAFAGVRGPLLLPNIYHGCINAAMPHKLLYFRKIASVFV
jgi:hypothetical protein